MKQIENPLCSVSKVRFKDSGEFKLLSQPKCFITCSAASSFISIGCSFIGRSLMCTTKEKGREQSEKP